MERNVWVINDNKPELLRIQQKINSSGGMRVICLASFVAVQKAIDRSSGEMLPMNRPSLIIVDYKMEVNEEFKSLNLLGQNSAYAGIPIAFMVEHRDEETDEKCYEKGASAIIHKNLKDVDVLRIKRMAWQHEKTANYEKILQKQVTEIQTAKKIKMLNEQLQSRNDLLYQIFGRYFTDEVVEKILSGPSGATIGGEKKTVTVMMADLRGFTSISEYMSPERLTDMINYFLGEMTEVILKYHGTVMEFIGDAILAIFGAPVELECCEEDAVAAAIEMQNKMQEVNEYNAANGYPEIEMGIGIHKGEVFVGNIGSDRMMRYNVIGSTVNQCSRIESCSVGGQVLVSEETINNIRNIIEVRNTFSIAAKGLSSVVNIWEICGIMGKYNQNLYRVENEKMVWVNKDIRIHMNEIKEKNVENINITGKLIAYSSKKCVIEIDNEEKAQKLNMLANVIMYAYDMMVSDEMFGRVYAKLVDKEESRYIFRITGNSREYCDWMELEHKRKEQYMSLDCNDKKIVVHEKYPFVLEMLDSASNVGSMPDEIKGVYIGILQKEDELKVYVKSNTNAIRAMEFIDYVFGDYGIIDGNSENAEGTISRTILKAAIEESDMSDEETYMKNKCETYFSGTDVYFAGKDDLDISRMMRYKKKRIPWAVVKTEDIAPEGAKLIIKSLENEGGTEVISGKDTYIMIGIRGEVYDINREKFVASYDISDEKLDVFESMMEFMPAVEMVDGNGYVAIDELAFLCYPKDDNFIYAKEVEKRVKIFRMNREEEYFSGNKGDYIVARGDDLKDIYIIQREIFRETYTDF